MDDLSSYGVDMNDPSTYCIDLDNLSDEQMDRLVGTKRWISRYFGKDFAEKAASAAVRGGSIAKKQKLHDGSASTGHSHSRLSPIITMSHAESFYDDPRDKIRSDLGDKEDSFGAEHCCDRCQLMTGTVEGLRALVSPEGYEHYTCGQMRQQSDVSGCPFCELVRRITVQCATCSQSAMEEGVIRIRGIAEDHDVADGNPFRPNPRLEALKLEIPMNPKRTSGCDSHHDHELGVLAYQESPVARYVVGRRPDKKLTPDLTQRMRTWLNDCQDNHESCPRRCSPVLPTRLVDIGDGACSPIRLQINQSGTRGQYAALSYCWGGDQPYKTTMSNLNSYTQELASTVLPKTLSDAIKVCREIGMRYIWIDALCIVQDDPKDKARELGHMGRIYKDATLTIMAASAKSVYEGFLDNAKIDAPEAKLPFHLNQNSFGAVFVRSSFASHPYFLDEEPIFNRAWTLQEMLLSSRVIMFDSYQVTLKCGQKRFWPVMDTYLHPESRLSSKDRAQYGTLEDFHLEKLAKEYREQASLTEQDAKGFTRNGFSTQSQMWTSVMAEYSRRDLSMLGDRYPALAGVTEELQKIWGGEFVAGFWKASLVAHLGWVGGVGVNEQFAGRKWEQRLEGPSWSWMSHPSPVSIDPLAITDAEVLGCEVELAFPDQPFGPVKLGSLVLEARTLPLSALQTKVHLRANVNPIWKRALAIMPEAMDGIALDFPERGLPEGELKAVVLGMTFSGLGEHCVSFLVLRKLEGDTYERIGHAVLHAAISTDKAEAIMSQAEREVVVIE